MERRFAVLADNEVFYGFIFDDETEVGSRWIAAILSNPVFINTELIESVCAGSTWDGDNFYLPNDSNPVEVLNESPIKNWVKYTGVVGNEVFGNITFYQEDFTDDLLMLYRAAFNSNPTIIETTGSEDVPIGSVWDGSQFIINKGA